MKFMRRTSKVLFKITWTSKSIHVMGNNGWPLWRSMSNLLPSRKVNIGRKEVRLEKLRRTFPKSLLRIQISDPHSLTLTCRVALFLHENRKQEIGDQEISCRKRTFSKEISWFFLRLAKNLPKLIKTIHFG